MHYILYECDIPYTCNVHIYICNICSISSNLGGNMRFIEQIF